MPKQLPPHAQVVIIGGGVVGCSVAYHLTKLGWQDVVLIERKVLTSGTTWAAAGLVGQLWASSVLTKLAKYGTELYSRLESETGQPTGFVRSGSLRVARTAARRHEYDRAVGMARAFGVEIEQISFEEASKLFPPMKTDDLVAVYYQPNDGHTSPVDTARAMAKGAQMGGASVFEGIYAHLLGWAMGMGYLENPEGISDDWILSGKYEIDVEGELIPAKVFLKAPYDPSSKRVRM